MGPKTEGRLNMTEYDRMGFSEDVRRTTDNKVAQK
jgi:hypothetical protein